MDALRALLNTGSPQQQASTSIESERTQEKNQVKAKKRAAFEAWHRRKLEQINGHIEDSAASSPREMKKRLVGDDMRPINAPVSVTSENKSLADLIRDELASQASLASAISFSSATVAASSPPSRPPSCGSVAKRLTAPKLSRHNDAAYYPNIQCILCKEWVCSRNRYMHIESHLQYRPYKCSVCGYDNRKEIFINLHIKKTHGNKAKVEYKPDPELEHRAWVMAEQCLQHTRDILSKNEVEPEETSPATVVKPSDTILARYSAQFRPRIFNSQRAEKSQLIEESRQKGLVPDFSEVASREAQCRVCDGFVLNSSAVLEEHVRTHLSQPSYRCPIDQCVTEHHSKNFLTRHMKEVHKYRKPPTDLFDVDDELRNEFAASLRRCFPEHFTGGEMRSSCRRWKTRWSEETPTPMLPPPPVAARRVCLLCQTAFPDLYQTLYAHVKTHLSVTPYQCAQCRFSDVNKTTVLAHVTSVHGENGTLENRMNEWLSRQCCVLLAACFPGLILQPWLHDPPETN